MGGWGGGGGGGVGITSLDEVESFFISLNKSFCLKHTLNVIYSLLLFSLMLYIIENVTF